MSTRFDHAMIAVRDLNTAIQRFQYLGFDTQLGGRHTVGGTHNALIRFGLDYIELLSVYDEAKARNFRGRTILDELNGRDASLVAYALATTTIEQDAIRFRGTEAGPSMPYPMRRKHPDGHLLSWRTLAPGGNFLGQSWPFLIQWDMPDEQRLQIDPPGIHPNGARAWIQVSIATNNLDSTIDIYKNQLGLEQIKQDASSHPTAHQATFRCGQGTIDLLAPNHTAQQVEKGEGPYSLNVAVKNLEQTRSFLEQKGIKFTHETTSAGKLVLDPGEAFDVRISFVG